jgi:pimeloyl-ACP methyl ester carboxylesterase
MATLGPTIGRCNFNPEVAAFYFSRRAPLYDLRDRLAAIRQPALVVVGEQDWLTPPSVAHSLVAGLPNSDLLVIPDAGGFAFVEQPEAFNSAVRQFAAAVPSLVGVGGV